MGQVIAGHGQSKKTRRTLLLRIATQSLLDLHAIPYSDMEFKGLGHLEHCWQNDDAAYVET